MTARRDPGLRRDALAVLGLARRRSSGPGVDVKASGPIDTATLELATDLARLARQVAQPGDDTRHRRLVVIVTATARAVADDLRSGTTTGTEALYLTIVAATQEGTP